MASRVAASVPIRAKMGKPLGGQAPYDYRYENKRLVIDETEGPSSTLSRGQSDSVHGQAHIPSNFICFWHQSASCVS
jgi:hypothetical protein